MISIQSVGYSFVSKMILINSDLYASITFIGWQLQFILRKIWQGLYVSKCLQRQLLVKVLWAKKITWAKSVILNSFQRPRKNSLVDFFSSNEQFTVTAIANVVIAATALFFTGCTANYNELYHFLLKRYKVQTYHACGTSSDCKLIAAS